MQIIMPCGIVPLSFAMVNLIIYSTLNTKQMRYLERDVSRYLNLLHNWILYLCSIAKNTKRVQSLYLLFVIDFFDARKLKDLKRNFILFKYIFYNFHYLQYFWCF